MGVETARYIRKPLYVDAVRVTAENFDEVAAWCDGKIEQGAPNPNAPNKKKKCIKVNVLSPKHVRQTMAFVGDWVLKQGDNFKIYTYKAFKMAFDEAPEGEPTASGSHEPRLLTETGADGKMKHEPPVGDLPPQPRRVGANVEIRDDRPKETGVEAEESAQAEEDIKLVPQAQPGSDLMDPPPPGGDMFPPESPDMKEARETIEADGGTVEEATPEGISQAARENEQARAATELAEKGVSEMVHQDEEDLESDPANGGKTVDEIIESHPDGPIAGMSEAAGESPRTEPNEADLARTEARRARQETHEPVTELNEAHKGKRVLSEHEQKILGPDEVRAMVRSGDVILAQDLAAAEKA